MTHTHLLYCAAAFASATGGPLSLAMVTLPNSWRYAEVIDRPIMLDEYAATSVLPKLTKIPGAHFVKSSDLHKEIGALLKSLAPLEQDTIDVRLFGGLDSRIASLFDQGAKQAEVSCAIQLSAIDLDTARLEDFYSHCGGPERSSGHALVNAIGGAICDRNRSQPTAFHEASIHHFELLMGSKNAASYRAWARTGERGWAEANASTV